VISHLNDNLIQPISIQQDLKFNIFGAEDVLACVFTLISGVTELRDETTDWGRLITLTFDKHSPAPIILGLNVTIARRSEPA
jgi:hypothetical protein